MKDIELWHGDCLEELPLIDDESVDLVILDPNYQDWERLCEQGIICQAVRVLKPTGNIICFTKQPFDFELRNEINYMFRREIVWTFTNGGAWVSNKMPLVSFQKIYWATPNKNFYFNPRTGLSYSNKTRDFKRSKKVFEGYCEEGKDFSKSDDGVWIRDHLHFNKPHCGKLPQKPYELIEILVKCFCPIGGIVLDPFMGSGTTGVSCVNTNRRFVGIELDENYYNMAFKRINEAVNNKQLKLF